MLNMRKWYKAVKGHKHDYRQAVRQVLSDASVVTVAMQCECGAIELTPAGVALGDRCYVKQSVGR